jgi:hypothetical protein
LSVRALRIKAKINNTYAAPIIPRKTKVEPKFLSKNMDEMSF